MQNRQRHPPYGKNKCQPFCRALFHIQLITMNDEVIPMTVPFRHHEREVLAGMSDATDRQVDLPAYESYRLAEGAKG